VGDEVWVDLRNAHGGLDVPGIEVTAPVAMVTAVGTGLGERAEVGLEMAGALERAGIAVGAQGGEGDSLWWEVAPGDLAAAVRRVHEALVDG
jgi:aspartokinase